MKRKRANYITRLKFICKWLFEHKSAYELGQIIYKNKLTGIGKYKCCENFEGSLAIYQWAKNVLSKNLPWNFGFKFKKRKCITQYMAKKLSRDEQLNEFVFLKRQTKNKKKE